MAILNVTPDSFSDGGLLSTPQDAVAAAERAVAAGAHVLDIGGESTRPGSAPVDAAEQMRRVTPAIAAIRERLPRVAITIDTTSAEVAAAALNAGADAINDTSAGLADSGMLALAAQHSCGIVLMHRPRRSEQDDYSDAYEQAPHYQNVVEEVAAFLSLRAQAALVAGVSREGIVIDPGLGFGKSVDQNLALIRGTGVLAALGYPVMSGLSRKSFVGRLNLGRDSLPSERVRATVKMSVEHCLAGARIFRVHDVVEHVAALAEYSADTPNIAPA